MKKILALLLAFTMIFGVVAPVTVSAVGVNPSETLFNELRTKFEPIRNDDDADSVIEILAVLAIKSGDIFNGLSSADKTYLTAKGIDGSTINDIIAKLSANSALIKNIIKDDALVYANVKDGLETLLMDLYEVLPVASKASIEKYAPTRADKLTIMANVVAAIMNTKIGTGNYNVTTSKWTALNLDLDDNYIKSINIAVSNTENLPLNDTHKSILNNFLDKSVDSLNDTHKDTVGVLLNKINLIEKVEVDKPSTPGGGSTGGGGTPSTPTPPIIEVPTDKDKPATAVVGKDYVEVTKDTSGKSTVKGKETELIKAIEDLRKAAGSTKEAAIELSLEDVKGLDFNVELSQELIESLVKNNVSLKVKTANSEVEIPLATLKGIDIPKGAKLELKVDEQSIVEAQTMAPDSQTVKKVIDLNLVVVMGNTVTKVTGFKEPITVKIDVKGLGDPDKLGVYYLNDETGELEFVTGKIIDGMAILTLDHFSEYAILESELTFEDIKSHWSKMYVESMVAKDVINGYEDGTFKPNNEVTRAEFSKMIVSALELDIEKYTGAFTDVKEDAWYSDYVGTMAKNGLVKGYEDGTFKPNGKITRAEMTMIISNALDIQVTETEKTSLLGKFKDRANILAWVENAVAEVVKAGIIVGDEKGNFNPSKTATRAESATAIYRLYNK